MLQDHLASCGGSAVDLCEFSIHRKFDVENVRIVIKVDNLVVEIADTGV